HKSANINVLFSYSDAFKGFNEWYIQLIAESLGKKQGYKRIGLRTSFEILLRNLQDTQDLQAFYKEYDELFLALKNTIPMTFS
ncbi:hypothetical protein VWM73_12760, partial [Campylobacter coli]